MKLSWSLVVLAILGIVAAVCAALLTTSIRASALAAASSIVEPEMTILVAAKDISAKDLIDEESIEERKLPKKDAPEGAFTNAAQVIGRRVSIGVKKGQTITPSILAANGTGSRLAAELQPGMRAVSLSLPHFSGLVGLLYPGCRVDVLAAFGISSADAMGQAISTTLLQDIEVLAVENFTIVSKTKENDPASPEGAKRNRKAILVTLLVTPVQAKALSVVTGYGRISLALRNPYDDHPVDNDVTLLNQGRLAQVATIMKPSVDREDEILQEENPPQAWKPLRAYSGGSDILGARFDVPQPIPPVTAPVAEGVSAVRRSASWEIDVIRGLERETLVFPGLK